MTREFKWLMLCVSLAAGEALGFAVSPALAPAWPVAVALAVLSALVGWGFSQSWTPFAVVFFAGMALTLAVTDERRRTLDDALELNCGQPTEVEFDIPDSVSTWRDGKGGVRASFPGVFGGVRVMVRVALPEGVAAPRPCERWAFAGWLERKDEDSLIERRTFWVIGVGSYARKVRNADATFSGALLRNVRSDLSRRVGLGLEESPETADLNRAILLGERRRISAESRAAFASAGTIHVFAISGLHVLVVARLIFVVLALLRVPLRISGLLLMPFLWSYVWLVGMGPSAVRAATMASFYYCSWLFLRRPSGIVSWSFAFLLTHALAPWRLLDVGCSLSFSVMLALALWSRVRATLNGSAMRAWEVAVIAWAAGVPVIAHTFGHFTPGGLLANIVAVPAAAVSVTAGVLGAAASYVSDTLATHFNGCAALATSVMAGVSRLVASLPFADVKIASWSFFSCCAWYAALAVAFVVARRMRRPVGGFPRSRLPPFLV